MLLKYYQKLDDAISYLAASFCNEKKLIKSVLGNKKISYVDIGTNQGTYLDFLSSFMKFKSIDCFEPLEELCNQLELNYSMRSKITSIIGYFSIICLNTSTKCKAYIPTIKLSPPETLN